MGGDSLGHKPRAPTQHPILNSFVANISHDGRVTRVRCALRLLCAQLCPPHLLLVLFCGYVCQLGVSSLPLSASPAKLQRTQNQKGDYSSSGGLIDVIVLNNPPDRSPIMANGMLASRLAAVVLLAATARSHICVIYPPQRGPELPVPLSPAEDLCYRRESAAACAPCHHLPTCTHAECMGMRALMCLQQLCWCAHHMLRDIYVEWFLSVPSLCGPHTSS